MPSSTPVASMGTTSREKALRLLYDDDLRHGKGTDHQQKCWQEIEWRLCQADPLYWFDHYAYITTKDDRIERWRLFPIQRMLISDWFEGYSCAAIKARQLGVTTLQVTYFLWRTLFKDAAKSFQVSDAEPKAIEALTKMAVTHDRLPQWMKDPWLQGGSCVCTELRGRWQGVLTDRRFNRRVPACAFAAQR